MSLNDRLAGKKSSKFSLATNDDMQMRTLCTSNRDEVRQMIYNRTALPDVAEARKPGKSITRQQLSEHYGKYRHILQPVETESSARRGFERRTQVL